MSDKPKRPWQFSMATMLVVMTLLVVLAAFIGQLYRLRPMPSGHGNIQESKRWMTEVHDELNRRAEEAAFDGRDHGSLQAKE